MTWSILARDENGHFGVAIASKFFAVGALCVHTRAGVGAISTQALMNPLYGPQGMALLAGGAAPDEVVRRLTGADAGQASRQLHVLGASGAGAAHTGAACVDWCGHELHEGFSVAGNMLAGAQVVRRTAQAFMDTRGRPLAERLLAAMAAGEEAGGDKRGKQSAALRIHGEQDYPSLDMRVDDHPDPIVELHRLYEVSMDRFQPFLSCLATRENPVGIIDRPQIDARIEQFQAARQRRTG